MLLFRGIHLQPLLLHRNKAEPAANKLLEGLEKPTFYT